MAGRAKWIACKLLLLLAAVTAGDAAVGTAQEARQRKDELLAAKVKLVVEAQKNHTDTSKLPPDVLPHSDVVEEVPDAPLWAGDGDLSTTGFCEADIERFCRGVEPGEGRLEDCLTEQLEEEEEGNAMGHTVSEACRHELQEFKRDRATSINKDLPLAKACREDIKKLCYKGGNKILACSNPEGLLDLLRRQKRNLSGKCAKRVAEEEEEEARDWRIDPGLHRACEKDTDKLCEDVDEDEEGAVTKCLLEKLAQVSQLCREQLHRVEEERAGDARLDRHLWRSCSRDMQRFCKGVELDEGRMEECLQDHQGEPAFSDRCREAVEGRMERAAADYELNYGLREYCAEDIEALCEEQRETIEMAEGFGADAQVITCLETQRGRIRNRRCAEEVHRQLEHEAEDIRFDHALATACHMDVKKHCGDVAPGSARVIGCLHALHDLSPQCSHKLFEHDMRLAEDIDFKYPMRRACAVEIALLCHDVPHGHARVVRCLQDQLGSDDMSEECRAEVQKDELQASADFRLNFRLHQACQADVQRLCSDVVKSCTGPQECQGRVIECLRDHTEELAEEGCRSEVLHEVRAEADDYRQSMTLSGACQGDAERLCSGIEPGDGRVHECLRTHMDQLSPQCRKEEVGLMTLQARDTRLQPRLQAACSEEAAVFCKDVEPGKGRMYRCLTQNMGTPGFGEECRQALSARIGAAQADYRLDYGVAKFCRDDVAKHCAAEDAAGGGRVLHCLVQKHKQLQGPCQDELSQGVRLALWGFKLGAPLTRVCDSDVQAVCPATSQKQGSMFMLGSVGRCLSKAVAEGKPLAEGCRKLVLVAAPSDARSIVTRSSASVEAVAARVAEIAKKAGLSAALVDQKGSGLGAITVTGWVAFLSVAALVVVVVGLAGFGLWRFSVPRRQHRYEPVRVMKQGDV